MKKIITNIYICTFLFTFLLMVTACNKNVLDVKNLNAVEPGLTWKDPQLANAYLANLYSRVMPNGWPARSGALYGGLAVDDTRGVINDNTIQISSHPWSGSFEDSYTDIRQVNILLKEIEGGSLAADVKNNIVAQALFLRAYSYFLLVRVYGGVPLLLEPQSIGDSLQVARASTADVFKAILADLDKSIMLLQGKEFVDGDYETGGIGGRRQYVDNILATNDDAYSTDPQSFGVTGLYARKGMQPELKRAEVAQNSVDWIEIRYAEVLLNLAEAANETGHTLDAIALVKQIRARAGILPGTGNYGITTVTKDDVRKLIYNERFIEFVFEGQRFWDLKRSRTLVPLTGQVQKGVSATLKPQNLPVDLTKKASYGYLPEDFDYTIGPILKASASSVIFSVTEKYYFAPIPLAQIQKNPKLEQNKDWGGNFNPILE